jgi:hypothetical protein
MRQRRCSSHSFKFQARGRRWLLLPAPPIMNVSQRPGGGGSNFRSWIVPNRLSQNAPAGFIFRRALPASASASLNSADSSPFSLAAMSAHCLAARYSTHRSLSSESSSGVRMAGRGMGLIIGAESPHVSNRIARKAGATRPARVRPPVGVHFISASATSEGGERGTG